MSRSTCLHFDPRQRPGVRSGLRNALQSLLGTTPLPDMCAGRVCGATILMYHSVAHAEPTRWIDPRNHMPPSCFEAQMRFLARRRRVVALSDLVDMLRDGETISPGTVVITFDDGYLDNLEVAADILDRLGLPATLFVPTGVIDRGENQWVDRLYAMFCARTNHVLHFDDERHDLATDAIPVYHMLCRRLLVSPPEDREQLLHSVHEQLAPHTEPPRLTLTWDELRSLASGPFSIQSHGVDHVDLRSHAGHALTEARSSHDRIVAMIGHAPEHFSFPYGRSCNAARDALHRTGYVSAVSDSPLCLIAPGVDVLAMPRVEAPASSARLAFLTSGMGRPVPTARPSNLPSPAHAERSP